MKRAEKERRELVDAALSLASCAGSLASSYQSLKSLIPDSALKGLSDDQANRVEEEANTMLHRIGRICALEEKNL